MRNNKEYKDEIFYSECCGNCKYFSEQYYSIEYTRVGLCFRKTNLGVTKNCFKVYYHNWCKKFKLKDDFKLEKQGGRNAKSN